MVMYKSRTTMQNFKLSEHVTTYRKKSSAKTAVFDGAID
jgi:hypothetical protein